MSDKQWERIFERLQEDILDRRGIKWEWSKVDTEIIDEEISPTWRSIVEGVLSETESDAL